MPELTLRDGMVVLGSLLILVVVVDAWRRMRQQQRSRVRVRLATDSSAEDSGDDLAHFRELPNGGARVVHRDELRDRPEVDETAGAPTVPGGGQATGSDVAPPSTATTTTTTPDAAAGREAGNHTAKQNHKAAPATDRGAGEADGSTASAPPVVDGEEGDETGDDPSPLAGVRADDTEPTNLDWLEDLPSTAESLDEAPGELPRQPDSEVIVLHVTAKGEAGFSGTDILDILLACDLRFGDMNFFHRHEQQAGRGPIQFSVANMLKPGVFDIDNMDAMETRGLVFFLTLPGPEDMIYAFDCMLETARAVARNLGGELLDESRSVLTQQAVEHSRQQIRELERRLRARGA